MDLFADNKYLGKVVTIFSNLIGGFKSLLVAIVLYIAIVLYVIEFYCLYNPF